ncbi:MAG TPA: hypothetical protein VFZ31_13640 [Vicinamibacterales bacterium]
MRILVAAVLLFSPPVVARAVAQDRPAPIVEIEAGWVGFADDGIVSETLFGAAARWYLSPRISAGPEVVYLAGPNHSHLVVTGNLSFDIIRERASRPVIPFLVIGGGMFRTHETFFDDAFTSSEGAFTAGGGVRAIVNDRVTVGLDARMGWEPHVRLNGTVGIRIGR